MFDTIIDIVDLSCEADGRRRTEALRCCQTLDDLNKKLKYVGFNISRSATYTRLIPHRANTAEGQRHVHTVTAKLAKAQTSEHKAHIEKQFYLASIRDLESLASFLGPKKVSFLSQYNKILVPLRITAANK